MKKEITFYDVYEIYGACASTIEQMIENKQKGNGMFLNFLFNNKARTLALIKEHETLRPKAGEKLQEYSKKEAVILKAKVIVVEGDSPDDAKVRTETYDQEIIDLGIEYKDAIEEWQKVAKVFNTTMDNKVTFDVAMLKEENLPSEISADVMDVLHKYVITK